MNRIYLLGLDYATIDLRKLAKQLLLKEEWNKTLLAKNCFASYFHTYFHYVIVHERYESFKHSAFNLSFFCRKDFYPCQPESERTLKFQRKVKKKKKQNTKKSLPFLAEYWNKNLKNK